MASGQVPQENEGSENGQELHGSQIAENEEKSITIMFLSNPIRYTTLNVNSSTTFSQLKQRLTQHFGVEPKYQKLMLRDFELLSDSKLFNCNLDDASLTLTSTDPNRDAQEQSFRTQIESVQAHFHTGSVVYGPNYITNHDVSRAGGNHNNDSDNELELFDKRPTLGLVGLKNQGATCYLNSLIQVLYLTPEFRRMIYKFPRPYDHLIGPNAIPPKEKPDPKFTSTKEPPKPDKQTHEVDKTTDILFQMQMLFARMQYANVSSVSTSGLTTSFGWDNSDIFVQHDVQELNRVLCDKLEEKMKVHVKDNDWSIAKLYKGGMLNMVACMNCKRVSTREEDYYDVSLVIKGKKDIAESLKEFTEVELMKDENAYSCEKCASKQTAEKSIKFKSLPKILNIQLKRFEYDWENNVRVKLNDEIGFPHILDMGPYMVDPKILHDIEKEKQAENKSNNNGIAPAGSDSLDSTLYELYGVLVHSGSAGFGHYYCFIKSFIDGKWYKFNDEHATAVDENDITTQNWIGGEKGFSWSSMAMQKSATPYMLVYRKIEQTQKIKDTSLPLSEEKSHEIESFKCPPVDDKEIPAPILEYLQQSKDRKEKRRVEKEKEMNSCVIIILRNRLELPAKEVKLEKNSTLEQLKQQIIATVETETTKKQYYRLRRVAVRKNQTKRPMELYKEEDYAKTLVDLGFDKRPNIYLEQSEDEHFNGLGDCAEDTAFVSVRLWSAELRRPTTVGDFIFPKTWILEQVKKHLEPYVHLPPDQMVIVEEETEKQLNLMLDDKSTLGKYSIISGDILHVESLCKEHYGAGDKISVVLTQQYISDQSNQLVLDIEETNTSYKRRTAKSTKDKELTSAASSDIKPAEKESQLTVESQSSSNPDEPKKWQFKLATNKIHTLKQIKDIIALRVNANPGALRVYAKDSPGYGGDGRLLKDSIAKLANLLQRFGGSRFTTELGFEIMDHTESLKKGDKLINIRYYPMNNAESVVTYEIIINKLETLGALKEKLTEKTGIPRSNQIISEWYNDHFYKLFPNENDTIASARIRKADILRMDAVKDASMNINESAIGSQSGNIALQLVQFIAWETTAYGRKEMQTTFPILITFNLDHTLYDLRSLIANRTGIPYHNLNVATSSNFPILEGYITPIKEHIKNHADPKILEIGAISGVAGAAGAAEPPENETGASAGGGSGPTTPPIDSDDPDDIAAKLAAKENREGKFFNFKVEKTVPLKKLHLRALDIICWEDLRTKVDAKQAPNAAARNRRPREGDGIKIKN